MKILCVGRNYAAHAAELGNNTPEEPVVFLKPDSAILGKGLPFVIPAFSTDIHHELEVVFKIGRVGKHIEPKFALRYLESVTVGIDFTARTLQLDLKNKGLPWEKARVLMVPPWWVNGFLWTVWTPPPFRFDWKRTGEPCSLPIHAR